ncbi:MAG: hypothetical protein M3304_08245 [Actinomycetota bacterium]|nr:hypothetical protein [Actinomycetota bacterium]
MSYRTRLEEAPTEETLRDLLVRAREDGAEEVVLETTHEAGDAWIRAGFSEVARVLVAPVDAIAERLGGAREASFGSIHAQTDDLDAVTRAVRQFVPRLPGGSRGSVVAPPRDGWTSVYDELCDREPEMLRRLARELSDRMGAFVIAIGAEEGRVVRYVALERGRVVDEYLSVPEYYGPLPPGEVIALGANPRLMARLTGADPEAVRRTARTARSVEELPAASELLVSLARVFGLPGAEHGYERARETPGAIELLR